MPGRGRQKHAVPRWQLFPRAFKEPGGAVAFSPDGLWLAIGFGRNVRIYDANGLELRVLDSHVAAEGRVLDRAEADHFILMARAS